MRTARILFTIVGYGALAFGLGVAAEPSDPARQPAPSESRAQPTRDRPSDEGHGVGPRAGGESANAKHVKGPQEVGRIAGKPTNVQVNPLQHAPGRADQKRPGNEPAKSATGASVYPAGVRKSAGAVNGALTPKKPEPLHRQPVLLSPILKPATKPSLPVAPSPSRVPAAIGGPTFAPAKNSAVLNGSEMKHKP